MTLRFRAEVTASLLDHGPTLAAVGALAAVVAMFGCFIPHDSAPKIAFQVSLILWIAAFWFAVRVRIDAVLFRALAVAGGSLEDLDELMAEWRLARSVPSRSIEDRCAGAFRLLRWLVICVASQVLLFLAGIALTVAETLK
jgi:hypothetical protein